ncbi:MAG: hypothetical protein R3F07_18155 [Opitutaceae bacterium]
MKRHPSPCPIGNRRELFLDDCLIERVEGMATRRLHHPQPREIVLRHDAPWEGNGCGYHSLFRDGDLYRLYYKAWKIRLSAGKIASETRPDIYTCYAESTDGINWTKPDLGIVERHGSTANNIILDRETLNRIEADPGHPALFRDDNPDATTPYKGFIRSRGPHGLYAVESTDGIRWSAMSDEPVITEGAFDSQNLAFWDAVRGEYRAYWRCFPEGMVAKGVWEPKGPRSIRTATSKDFVHWDNQADLTYTGSPPAEELYVNQVKPYHRAPHLLIGFPARYLERPWGSSMRALPDREFREFRSSAQLRYGTALSESLLMSSRDGVEFARWPEGFLRPGPERSGTWNYGHQYLAWHLVETASSLGVDGPNELSLYAVENYWMETGSALRRYTLRLDGFVSLNAPAAGGECLTRPIVFNGSELRLNFASSIAGDVRVEIQDETGRALEGFRLDECDPVFGDAIDRPVTWKNGPDVRTLSGRPVRLRFVLKDADLYAYRFCQGG